MLTEAANILEISEYEVLGRAYRHWYGHTASADLLTSAFGDYLNNQALPPWARHYAVEVIREFETGQQQVGIGLRLFWRWAGADQRTPDARGCLAA